MTLANGLKIQFVDSTRRYYGNFYQVRITVTCSLPLVSELFESPLHHEALRRLLGNEAHHERVLEKMGVAGDDVDTVRDHLLAQFRQTSIPYLSSPSFPRRFVGRLLLQMQKQGRITL